MFKWSGVMLLVLAVFYANADDFFVVPVKSVRFIHKKSKNSLNVKSYTVAYETKFDCIDSTCQSYRANSSSSTEVSGAVDGFKTLPMQIPRMPDSGPLMLTFTVPGVCRKHNACTAKISYDKFMKAEEPVTFAFDYDDVASKDMKFKRQKAEADSLAEIEQKLGKTREVSSLTSDPWKKQEEDFLENRKKLNPMNYSKDSVSKLGLNTWLCGKNLQDKVSKCDVHACIFAADLKGVPVKADFIIHGFNRAGNCAISLPSGKRFFVPKTDLAYFYDSFLSLWGLGMEMADPCLDPITAAVCREKKTDLLFQLHNRRLATEYVPVQIGVVSEK